MIDADPVFSADRNLIGDFRKENGGYRLQYDFQLTAGTSRQCRSPADGSFSPAYACGRSTMRPAAPAATLR
jgi:hypothetical protein